MIFTFYSFKGGVGRSMALAGVAQVLSRRGLRVLAVDFDLEAPGLERYFFEGERGQGIRRERGLIDLIQCYRQALADPAEFERAEFKRWQDFRLEAVRDAGSLGGSVDLMTAGQRAPAEKYREYALTVRTFDWQDFFHNWKGDLFFDWLRRQWRDPQEGYDVVLVDSRTGVTEMGGVCAYQLADVAVLLCAPNYQNLEGTLDVARDFRSDAVLGLRAGRPLEILAVPARLEERHPQRDSFLDRFEAELGVEGLPMVLKAAGLDYRKLALPYLPEFSVEERLIGEGGAADARVIAVFERLADALTLLAEPGSRLAEDRDKALARLGGQAVEEAIPLEADTTRSSAGNDVFLDFSFADAEWAERLRARLEEAGLRIFTLDRDAQPGSNWTEVVERALDYSQSLFVCFGAESSSRWRDKLISRARRRENILIVPVLLPNSDPGMLRAFGLSEYRWLDLRNGTNASGLREFIAHLLQPKRDTRKAALSSPRGDPYPGSRSYGEDDASFFVGREAEIEAVLAALQTHHVVLIQGPAKVGKSSLVAAGVAAKLREGARNQEGGLLAASVTLYDLASYDELAHLMARAAWHGSPDCREEAGLGCDVAILDGIDSFPDAADSADNPVRRMAEITRLLGLAGAHLKIILVGRDTLPDDLRAPFLAEWGPRMARIDLEPLQGEALRRAIEEPAKRAGHLLEPGLTERLIESAGAARSAVFQIQLTLSEMWPMRRRGWLTNATLNVLGHLGGIFTRHLESVLAGLTEGERGGAKVLFKRLVSLDSALKLKPEQQVWGELAAVGAIDRAVGPALRDRLAAAGVIDLYRTAPCAEQEDAAADAPLTLALVRPDPLVYFGGDAVPDAPFLLWRGQFVHFVRLWTRTRRDPNSLLSPGELMDAERWLNERGDEFSTPERELVLASRAFLNAQDAEAEQRTAQERDQERKRLQALADAERARAAASAARAEAETRARQVHQDAATTLRKRRRQLLGALMAALAMLGLAVVAWNKAEDNSREAIAAQSQTQALRLAIEGQAMIGGARPGGEFRGIQQILAAHRLGPDREIDAIVLNALLKLPRLRKLIPTGQDSVWRVAYSPEGGRIVSGGKDGSLRLWDGKTGASLGDTIPTGQGPVWSVAFSPDGERIVSSGVNERDEGSLRLWDGRTGVPLGPAIQAGKGWFQSLAYSPDGGRIVSISGDGSLRLWDGKTGAPLVGPIPTGQDMVTSVAYSPDGGRIVSGGMDRSLRLWDGKTGAPLGEVISTGQHVVTTMAYSPDGVRIVSGGQDGSLRLWDGKTGAPLGEPIPTSQGRLEGVAYSPDGERIVSAGEDRTLRFWGGKAGEALGETISTGQGSVHSVAYSPDGGRIVSGGGNGKDDGSLRLWDGKSGAPLGEVISTSQGRIESMAYSPDGERIVSGGMDGSLRLWNGKTGDSLGEAIPTGQGWGMSVAYSPDGGRIVSGGQQDGSLRLWDGKSGAPLSEAIPTSQGAVTSVAYSPNGERIVSGGDGSLRLWDGKSGAPLGPTIPTGQGYVESIAYSPDGERVVSGGDGSLRLWDGKNGAPLGKAITIDEGEVMSVVYSSDGGRIASGGKNGNLRLWDGKTGAPLGEPIATGQHGALSLAYSPDGGRIVSGSRNNLTLRLWDGKTGAPLGEPIPTGRTGVTSVAYSPDGGRIVAGGDDGTLFILPDIAGWAGVLCSRLSRNMSWVEWQEWVGKHFPYRRPCPELPWPDDLPADQRHL